MRRTNHHVNGTTYRVWLWLILAGGLLAGCMAPAPMPVNSTTSPAVDPAATRIPSPVAVPTSTPMSVPTVPPTPDPAQPTILVTQDTDAGPLYLIRYQGGQGLCIALTFDTQTLAVNHCGLVAGRGVGFVDTITAPDGRAARAAYGLAPNEGVTAVAIEFSSGGNTPATVSSGGYILVLGNGQTPRRATGIDQFGNMAGQWGF